MRNGTTFIAGPTTRRSVALGAGRDRHAQNLISLARDTCTIYCGGGGDRGRQACATRRRELLQLIYDRSRNVAGLWTTPR